MKLIHKMTWRPLNYKGSYTLDGVCEVCGIEQHDITPDKTKQTKKWKMPSGELGKDPGCIKQLETA